MTETGDYQLTRRHIGVVALAGYIATVVLANYFIQHVGHVSFPHGPHTIPVGFGYQAPSGVLWVGLAFTLRDFVQSNLGKRWGGCRHPRRSDPQLRRSALAGVGERRGLPHLRGARLRRLHADEWKLGRDAQQLMRQAKALGLWCHMGRVNSLRRLRVAATDGYDSVDGTYLAFGPDTNLPKLLRYLRWANEPNLGLEAV